MSQHYYKTSIRHIKGIRGPMICDRIYRRGDIVYAVLGFEDGSGSKGRPIAYLGGDEETVRYVKCTTVYSIKGDRIPVGDPVSAGLNRDTYLDTEVRTTSRKNLKYYIGHLCDGDLEYLMQSISQRHDCVNSGAQIPASV